MDEAPPDSLSLVFEFLSTRDLCRVARTCQRMKSLAEADRVWDLRLSDFDDDARREASRYLEVKLLRVRSREKSLPRPPSKRDLYARCFAMRWKSAFFLGRWHAENWKMSAPDIWCYWMTESKGLISVGETLFPLVIYALTKQGAKGVTCTNAGFYVKEEFREGSTRIFGEEFLKEQPSICYENGDEYEVPYWTLNDTISKQDADRERDVGYQVDRDDRALCRFHRHSFDEVSFDENEVQSLLRRGGASFDKRYGTATSEFGRIMKKTTYSPDI